MFLTASIRRVGRGKLSAEAINIILSTFRYSLLWEYFSFNPSNPLELSNRTKQQSTKNNNTSYIQNPDTFQFSVVNKQTRRWIPQDRESLYYFITTISFIFPKKLREKSYIFMINKGMFLYKFQFPQITGLVLSILRDSSLKKIMDIQFNIVHELDRKVFNRMTSHFPN